jgi:thiol-disulfide isomerase/thioredoxin
MVRVASLLLLLQLGPLAAVATAPGAEPLDASLRRLDGTSEKLSQLRGQRLLLDLWATWCEPCRTQAEIVRDLGGELERLGIEVLAVNVGESPKTVERFLAGNPAHARVLLDRGQLVAKRLDIGALPALVLLREDGTVAAVREGVVQREELAKLLLKAFAATPTAGAEIGES